MKRTTKMIAFAMAAMMLAATGCSAKDKGASADKAENGTTATETISEQKAPAEETENETAQAAEQTNEDSSCFFIKDNKYYETLLPGDQNPTPEGRSQLRVTAKGEWEETGSKDGKYIDFIKNRQRGFYPFDKNKWEGQDDLEFFRDSFFDEYSLLDFFENVDLDSNTPDGIEMISEEKVTMPNGEEVLKFKGYLYFIMYFDENVNMVPEEELDSMKVYCEGFLGEHPENYDAKNKQHECFINLAWTEDRTEEGSERLTAYMDEIFKDYTASLA